MGSNAGPNSGNTNDDSSDILANPDLPGTIVGLVMPRQELDGYIQNELDAIDQQLHNTPSELG